MANAQGGPLRYLSVLSGLGVVLATAAPAWAQAPTDKSVEVQLFQTAIGPKGFLTVDSASVPAHKTFGLGLFFNYQRTPFSLFTSTAGSELKQSVDVIKQQISAELTGAVGLFDKMQVGFALPMTLKLDGRDFTALGQPAEQKLTGAGLGDLRVEAKGLLSHTTFGGDEEGQGNKDFFVSGALGLTLPTGDDSKFLGDKSVTVRPRIIAEFRDGDIRAGGYVGALFRSQSQVFKADVSHQFLYGVATEYSLHRQVSLIAELFGRNGFNRYVDSNPMELDVGMRVKVTSMFAITLGGGAGLIKGIGSPKARGFFGLAYYPDFRDADADGVYDLDDRCPDGKEDMDGFKDRDGCPDPDNDGDGIEDGADKCPTEAEDLDQFEDEDGCPEADNDKDGLPDIKDPCPNAAEDGQGKRPTDGCPSTTEDSDGDGVVDAKDQCGEEPEDRDGFQDYDGCPDVDNDDDGIPDQFDSCPIAAEDADGFSDEDGCPDPDNDKDGFLDAKDQCPTEPETLNGNKDEDGCPDAGAEVVHLADSEIELKERIAFKGNALAAPGQLIVNLVALVLNGHQELTLVRLEVTGATDAEAKARAEAVKKALVAKGVADARLKVAAKTGKAAVQFIIETKAAPPGAPTGGQ
ncbi:MAG: thrombospondin type 3 repeat-containing protein [Deltaproteobacteria bacterium]|nr:thrombospondin type 3 repeat-containing protein [Deltaproteobacteria bacterium]